MSNLATSIYRKDFFSFVEKAFLTQTGKHLKASQKYIAFVVYARIHLSLVGVSKIFWSILPGLHLKTFMCSICLPAFALGLNPTLQDSSCGLQ